MRQREEKARERCGRKRTIERDRAETWERAREGMREMGQRNAERVGERVRAQERKQERDGTETWEKQRESV